MTITYIRGILVADPYPLDDFAPTNAAPPTLDPDTEMSPEEFEDLLVYIDTLTEA